jgi:hypothetical protein
MSAGRTVLRGEDGFGEVGVFDVAGEAVGAEQDDVVGFEGFVEEVGVHVGLGTDGAGDDRLQR